MLEQLESLGYLASGSAENLPHPLAETGLPSPRESAPEFEKFLEAHRLRTAGDLRSAIEILERLMKGNPRNRSALDYLATFLLEAGRFGEAKEALIRLLNLGGERVTTHLNLGFCLIREGDLEAAKTHFLRSLELDPRNVKALHNLAQLHEDLGFPEEAESYRQRLRLATDGAG